MSYCSIANIVPVRPKPVCTSSTMSTIPCSLAISRTPWTKSFGAVTKPLSPWTGSKMIAATSSAATRVLNARLSSASAVAVSGPR